MYRYTYVRQYRTETGTKRFRPTGVGVIEERVFSSFQRVPFLYFEVYVQQVYLYLFVICLVR